MKKIVSLLLLVSMLAALALTLVGCGAPKDDGARINIYLGNEVCDFDPTDYYVDSNAEQVMSLLFEPLFRYQNGKIKGAMAEDYEVNEEERTIVITLRESYWSNNTRVKAADFVYAWSERLLNPANPNPAAALLYDIENALDIKKGEAVPSSLKVEATDVYELTITYREGADYKQLLRNLASVATSPIREPADPASISYWSKSVVTAFSNGPFKLTSYETLGTGFTLSRNRGYHQDYAIEDYDDEVNPGELVVLTTPYGEAIEASYADIENKVTFFLSDATLEERAKYEDKAKLEDDTSVYTYVFNNKKDLFAIAEVRQALSMAIDREAIAAAVVYGKAADGFLPDVSGGSEDELISTKANVDGAKQLLESVKNSLPADRSIKLTVANDEESKKIAELVKASWESLGYGITVTVVPVGTVETEITVGGASQGENGMFIKDSAIQAMVKRAAIDPSYDYDVIAVDWQTYSNDPFVALASLSSTINGCGKDLPDGKVRTSIARWSDTNYDALVNAAYAETDEDEKAEYIANAEKRLCEALPVVPILFNQNATIKSKDLSKIKYDDFGNVIFTKVSQRNYKKYLEDEE